MNLFLCLADLACGRVLISNYMAGLSYGRGKISQSLKPRLSMQLILKVDLYLLK